MVIERMRRRLRQLPPARAANHYSLRLRTAAAYLRRPLAEVLPWLLHSRETTNFTYDLTPLNRRYLAALLTDVTGHPYDKLARFIDELQQDGALREHIRRATLASDQHAVSDTAARYGRRLGWYALTRTLRPRVVVETGVDKGLGSCVICAALLRNAAEGSPGRYYGTDINPRAGYLLGAPYNAYGEILYGDSLASLEQMAPEIDLFINDSDHSADYEAREYETVADKLSPGAVILGDNAHVTDALLKFAQATGRHFVFFQEVPSGHWYPGAGIGIAFRRDT